MDGFFIMIENVTQRQICFVAIFKVVTEKYSPPFVLPAGLKTCWIGIAKLTDSSQDKTVISEAEVIGWPINIYARIN